MILFQIWFVKNTIHDSENLRSNYNNRTNFEQRNYTKETLEHLYANIGWNLLYDN